MTFEYNGSGDAEASTGFKLMPEETSFQFEVVDAEETTSKAGNQMLKMVLTPTAPEFSNRKIFHYVVVNDHWENNISKILNSAGKDPKKAATFEANQIMGWTVQAQLKHEEYNDKVSEKIHFFEQAPEQVEAPAQVRTIDDKDLPF